MSAAVGTARRIAGTDFLAAERGPSAASAPAVATAWRVFAAQPLQVACARRFVAGVLSGLRAADDVVLCVSELASNSVLHSSSREPGGHFVVRALVNGAGRIRAEVEDRGGPWTCPPGHDEEHGRGLLIVGGLATRWGITGSDAGRVAWLELDPPDPATLRQQLADGRTDST